MGPTYYDILALCFIGVLAIGIFFAFWWLKHLSDVIYSETKGLQSQISGNRHKEVVAKRELQQEIKKLTEFADGIEARLQALAKKQKVTFYREPARPAEVKCTDAYPRS